MLRFCRISVFDIDYGGQVTALKCYTFDEILSLQPSIFCSNKKMVSSPFDTSLFRFFPVAFEVRVNIPDPFCCFNKRKLKFNVLHLHCLNHVPGNSLLVPRNINAMNLIFIWNGNTKFRVPNKSQLAALPPQITQVKNEACCRYDGHHSKQS